MTGFKIARLDEMLDEIGEDTVKSIIADYSCPLNGDIDRFLKHDAIVFSNMRNAITYLVFASYIEKWVLVGYFTLANKSFVIKNNAKLSKALRKKINKFGRFIPETESYEITAPLIAQLGKNYTNEYNKLISGDELLQMACDRVKAAQSIIGGKIAYLECENKPRLIEFYNRNGFYEFGIRMMNRLDKAVMEGSYLVQLLRYF